MISIIAGLRLGAKKGNGVVKLSMAVAEAVPMSKPFGLDVKERKNNKNPIVVIDNYDSFTYNLCQVCCSLYFFFYFLFHFTGWPSNPFFFFFYSFLLLFLFIRFIAILLMSNQNESKCFRMSVKLWIFWKICA